MKRLYRYITYMKPNEHEASLLSGIQVSDYETAVRAGRILLDKGVNKAVVITMGGSGAVLVERNGEKVFPCAPVPVRDTTSAGDTFAGAFVAGTCLRHGAFRSSHSCCLHRCLCREKRTAGINFRIFSEGGRTGDNERKLQKNSVIGREA